MGYSFEFNQRTSESAGIHVSPARKCRGKRRNFLFLKLEAGTKSFRWKQYLRKLRDYIGMLLSDRTG